MIHSLLSLGYQAARLFAIIAIGLAVFGVAQVLFRLWVDPIHEHAKAIGAAAFALFYYGKYYANPGHYDAKTLDDVSAEIRRAAAGLAATGNAIRFYRLSRLFGLVPCRSRVGEAIGLLTAISNSMWGGNGADAAVWADRAYAALGLGKFGRAM